MSYLDNTTGYGTVVTNIEWFASLKEETVGDPTSM